MNNWTKIFSVIMVVAGGAMIVVAIIIDNIGLGAPGFGWKQVLLSLAGIVIILAGFGLGTRRLPVLSRLLGSYGIYLFGIGLMLGTFTIGLAIGSSIGDDAGSTDESFVLLHELINRDYPELENEQIDDWGKVKLLRQWTHEYADWGTEHAQFNQEQYAVFFNSDAPEIFSMFIQDEGAVMCQGTAYALTKLYSAYGFETYILGVGIPDIMTHAVTLVRINYDGQSIFAIQDPTFDISYVDSNGTPYDYFDMLGVLKSHYHHLIEVEYGVGRPSDFLLHPMDEPYYGICIEPDDEPIAELPDGRLKYKNKETLAEFNDIYGDSISAALKQDGHPPDTIYLFLYLLYIQDEHLTCITELENEANSVLGDTGR